MKTHLDLFSGIGGFSLAAQWAGFQTIAFCEIEPYAQQVLIEKLRAVLAESKNVRKGKPQQHEHECSEEPTGENGLPWQSGRSGLPFLHPDIFTLDGTQYRGVTLLTGGFPCQPFSCAGKRRGKEDDRHLWPQMLRVIKEAQPAYVLAENVPGIINMELDHCLSDLEAIGYATGTLVVPACAVDARHRRDRVWILAVADSEHSIGRTKHKEHFETYWGNGLGRSGETVADPNQQGSKGWDECGECTRQRTPGACRWSDEADWFAESGMGRVAHGIPARTHRLRALGNAIVPQVAYQILKALP